MLKHLPLWLLIYYFLVFVTTLVNNEATMVPDANTQNTLGSEIPRFKPLVQLVQSRDCQCLCHCPAAISETTTEKVCVECLCSYFWWGERKKKFPLSWWKAGLYEPWKQSHAIEDRVNHLKKLKRPKEIISDRLYHKTWLFFSSLSLFFLILVMFSVEWHFIKITLCYSQTIWTVRSAL